MAAHVENGGDARQRRQHRSDTAASQCAGEYPDGGTYLTPLQRCHAVKQARLVSAQTRTVTLLEYERTQAVSA